MGVFNETVNIQGANLSTGQVSGALSLADRIKEFGDAPLALAQKQLTASAQKRGREEAAGQKFVKKGGVTQSPEFKEEHFIGSVRIKEHNKALLAGYTASLSTDIITGLAKIEEENPTDSIGFNEKVEGFRQGLMKSVEPSLQPQVMEFFESKAIPPSVRVRKRDIAIQSEEARQALELSAQMAQDAAAREARNGDLEESAASLIEHTAAINALVEKGDLTTLEGSEAIREADREATEQVLRAQFDVVSDESIEDAYTVLDAKSKKVPKGFTPDEWDTYIDSQRVDINRKAVNLRKEIKLLQKELLQQQSLTRGLQFTDPDVPADPAKSGQDRKDVNAAFKTKAQEWQGLPAPDQIKNIEGFIQNTGIIPDILISKSSAAMRSGNPEQVVIFSKIVNDLANSKNPSVLRDLPDQTRAVALQITSSVNAGLDVETASQIARKNTYGITASDKERIKLETQAIRPELPSVLDDILDENFDPSIIGFELPFANRKEEPPTNTAIQADFNVAFESFMIMTDGNSEQSAKLAEESIVKVWGPNDVDGDFRMMKFAPSVFYSVQGVDDDWMQTQFQADLTPFGKTDNFRIGINVNSIASGEPTYPVLGLDDNGLISPVFDNEGRQIEWKPDFTKTREYKELQAIPGRKREEAKDTIDRMKQLKQTLGIDSPGFL